VLYSPGIGTPKDGVSFCYQAIESNPMQHPRLSRQHIYLSPHFDDAVLSCGGKIARQVAAGENVVVATVFGGEPAKESLSPFAVSIHARPDGSENLIPLRRLEENQALAVLGADSRPGDYLDCIYRRDTDNRRWLYDHEEALFGPVDPAEQGLAYELAQVFATLALPGGSCDYHAPLAVGDHVDHQIVRRAALILQHAGYEVLFYEDFPYVERDPAGLESALDRAGAGTWQPVLIDLDQAAIDCKIEAIAAYRSQIGVLFGEASDVAPRIRAYAKRTGGGAYAERQWRLSRQGNES
jgi:LmbE family N-acetylglucosaminyl deacetylase